MTIREVKAAGHEALMLASALLQRARLADPLAGLWEAADVQWWWRKPRRSDEAEKLFWINDEGPVAGVLLTSFSDDDWQCDPLLVPGTAGIEPGDLWHRALAHAVSHAPSGFQVPIGDDDETLREPARQSGLTAGEQDSTAWMAAANRPALTALPPGFVLTDRSQRAGAPHPMQARNGEEVAARLAQGSLYDPALDLAIQAADGQMAAYSLYWFDPVTKVGLVEPVRVEGDFQRRGLARAMLAVGIERLASKGAERIKVSYASEAAGALYLSLGFVKTSTATWYQVRPK